MMEIADILVAMREAPRCNQIRSMGELAMPIQDTSVEINIGHAQSAWRTGQLKFSILVSQDGSAYVQVYAHDPSDLRKSGVVLSMGEREWQDFMQVLHAVQAGITRVHQTGQMRVFAVPDPSRLR